MEHRWLMGAALGTEAADWIRAAAPRPAAEAAQPATPAGHTAEVQPACRNTPVRVTWGQLCVCVRAHVYL